VRAGALLGLVFSVFSWASVEGPQRTARIEINYPGKKEIQVSLNSKKLVILQDRKKREWSLNDCARDFADIFWFQDVTLDQKKSGKFSLPSGFSKRVSSYDIESTVNKKRKFYLQNSAPGLRLARLSERVEVLDNRLKNYCGVQAK